MFQTEFDFALPKGLIDEQGEVHRHGRMRLATARDELYVQAHHRVRQEPDYGTLVMLSQVITQLGPQATVSAEQLEQLFSRDLAYLREFFNRINQQGDATLPAECPACHHRFQMELTLSGES